MGYEDEDDRDDDECGDARTARVLKDIANDVQLGITMEDDFPSRNEDNKLPILDMKVWTDDKHNIVYEHYEKGVASKKVLHQNSAQSQTCKKSVHVRELVRRMLNTSIRLDWDSVFAPILTDYMERMKRANYDEKYRRSTLAHALRIYDKMRKEDEEGTKPLHRPRNWNLEEKRIEKRNKKHTWSTKGGYTAPIMVPATPNSELLNLLRDVAEREAVPGVKFKVLETGGTTVKQIAQKSNPTATPGCPDANCIACKHERGGGGQCRQGNVGYQMECVPCQETATQTERQRDRTTYIGETSRNLYTRGMEHTSKYETQHADSFMMQHQVEKHNCQPADFTAKVTGRYRDCLTRQVAEGVAIRRCQTSVLNSKSEWHQPALWKVRSELERG